jgi:hypothetical protein
VRWYRIRSLPKPQWLVPKMKPPVSVMDIISGKIAGGAND